MKNEQILKYRNIFEKAAEFAVFLDGIEASCSRESNAAFPHITYSTKRNRRDRSKVKMISQRTSH